MGLQGGLVLQLVHLHAGVLEAAADRPAAELTDPFPRSLQCLGGRQRRLGWLLPPPPGEEPTKVLVTKPYEE